MKVEVWSRDNCAFCVYAKKLLESKNIEYTEKKIGDGYSREDLLEILPEAKTLPQIFIDGEAIGGYDQLVKRV